MSSKPSVKFRVGNMNAAVWKNDSDNRSFYSVTLVRSYKDSDGQWQNSDGIGAGDLLNAMKVLERCENWIAEK